LYFGGAQPESQVLIAATAHAGSSLADFSTLKMEAIRSSEMSVHTRSTRRHIPEEGILHSHRRENLKSCKKEHKFQLPSEGGLPRISFRLATVRVSNKDVHALSTSAANKM
jgi:hypothetical protein